MAFFRIVRVRNGTRACVALGLPLVCSGRALGQFPLIAKKIDEKVVAPFGWRWGPGNFKAAADGSVAIPAAKIVLPAQALFFNTGALRLATDILHRVGCAMSLSEGVTAGDKGNCLLVIHRHASECFADVARGRNGVRIAVWTLGVHVDEAHLNCAKRIFELAVALVALVSQPLGLRSPINVFFRFPDVGAAAAEAEGLE